MVTAMLVHLISRARIASIRVSHRSFTAQPKISPNSVLSENHSFENIVTRRQASPKVSAFIEGYRQHGHEIAQINPLGSGKTSLLPELDPTSYGLNHNETVYIPDGILYSGISGIAKDNELRVSDLSRLLQDTYCGGIGAEVSYLPMNEREWLFERMEQREELYPIHESTKIRAGILMSKATELNRFLGLKFATVKRYSGEGAESMLVAVDEIFLRATDLGVKSGVIGMPHRGRNALLTCLLGHAIEPYLLKMQGHSEFPKTINASGDTFSHFYLSDKVHFGNSESAINVSLLPNPSHLEAVAPVAAGKARGKMQTLKDGYYGNEEDVVGDKVMCLLMHGDASMTGQGVVTETGCIAYHPNYSVGGSVHLVVNNQLGFTTDAHLGRSSPHPTDVIAKGLSAPVLHVNGENLEEVIRAARIAVDYRHCYRRDVFIDLVCYRRWGHNELDDPTLTQPTMYSFIGKMRPVSETFTESLPDEAQRKVSEETTKWTNKLQNALRDLSNYQPTLSTFGGRWKGLGPAPSDHLVIQPTGVSLDRLRDVGNASVSIPDHFNCHPSLIRSHVDRRRERISSGKELDWATAEALAVGSLMQEGIDCRISGQDVARGTFSHRHFMLVDQATNESYIPLNTSLEATTDGNGQKLNRGCLEIANSPISEEGVLSFEYGFSLESPDRLVLWEAQFGDFVNSAQVPFDTYIASGETKWMFQSGLVVILPHGYDGAGPEHSSARIERILQLTDSRETVNPPDGEDRNMIVVNPTLPAQYFHVLRRQVMRPWRKPLIIIGPKMLIRHPKAVSDLDDMKEGTYFRHILPDPDIQSGLVDPSAVRRVVLCSGKHFFALQNARKTYESWDTALIRIEQLCPFPIVEIVDELKRFPKAEVMVWGQEEHRNMGAWKFVQSRVEAATGMKLHYAGRDELATPAVGIAEVHRAEVQLILDRTFKSSTS